jgi:hypothetical protein
MDVFINTYGIILVFCSSHMDTIQAQALGHMIWDKFWCYFSEYFSCPFYFFVACCLTSLLE